MKYNCPFCKSPDYTSSFYPALTFNQKQFEYVTCKDCELVYISPLLDNSDLTALYSLDYHQEFYFSEAKSYSEQLDLLGRLNIKGRLLDYGCGDGSFLRFCKNKGFELCGAEYNPALVERLSKENPDSTFFTIEQLLNDEHEKFDIIHLGDVLEHLVNPAEIITSLKKKLTPNGIFFIEGPIEHNFNLGFQIRKTYFKARKALQPNRSVDTFRPYHIFFANGKNQLAFFNQQGLQLLHFQIFEWAWPFPERWQSANSLNQKVQYLFGKASKLLSKTNKSWGNRFYYVGRNYNADSVNA